MKPNQSDDLTRGLQIQTKIESKQPLSREEEEWLKTKSKTREQKLQVRIRHKGGGVYSMSHP